MKKIVLFILAVIMLSSCFGMTSLAAFFVVEFSDDFQTLYTNDTSYFVVDPSYVTDTYKYIKSNNHIQLSPAQEENVKEIYLSTDISNDEKVFCAEITYKNGMTLSVTYLRKDLFDEYTKLLNGECESYVVDYIWPEGNTVTATKDSLLGEEVTLTGLRYKHFPRHYVYANSNSEIIRIPAGCVFIYEDEYYYADYKEMGIDTSSEGSFSPEYYDSLTVHKITDPDLVLELNRAHDRLNNDDFGFFNDDDFTEEISTIFILVIFAAIPLIVFIWFLILSIRAKGIYKKLYTTVTIISAAELVIFAVLAIMINTLPK